MGEEAATLAIGEWEGRGMGGKKGVALLTVGVKGKGEGLHWRV